MPGACVHHALSCISLSRATPLGRSRYQTSEFPTSSELPTELPTHTQIAAARNLLSLYPSLQGLVTCCFSLPHSKGS